MKFYFDESGDFAIPSTSGDHRVAVVAGLCVPELVEAGLLAAFATFVANLSAAEKDNGEPKGSRLTPAHRAEFCELLGRYKRDLSLTPVTIDLGSLVGLDATNESLSQKLHKDASTMEHDTARRQMAELAQQVGNLSPSQALRLFAWTNCFRKALDHAMLFRSAGPFRDCWTNLRFEIDRVQKHAGNREERALDFLLPAWLDGWSRKNPVLLIRQVHVPDLPMMKLYDTPQGFDLRKILDGNVVFVDSRTSQGVQMADIAANIIAQGAIDLDDRNGNVTLFGRIMRASPYGPDQGPGLVSPSAAVADLSTKYKSLSEAMRTHKQD